MDIFTGHADLHGHIATIKHLSCCFLSCCLTVPRYWILCQGLIEIIILPHQQHCFTIYLSLPFRVRINQRTTLCTSQVSCCKNSRLNSSNIQSFIKTHSHGPFYAVSCCVSGYSKYLIYNEMSKRALCTKTHQCKRYFR